MSEDFVNASAHPANARAWGLLARGDLDAAQAAFAASRRAHPDDPDAPTGLARVAASRGLWSLAAGQAGIAARLARTDQAAAAAHAVLGKALIRLEHFEPARAALQVALLHEPDHLEALAEIAHSLRALHRPVDALASLDRACAIAPRDPALRSTRATVLGELGRHDEALQDFRIIAALLPDDSAAHANLGAGLFTDGQLDDAAQALDHALGLGPPSARTLNNVGLVAMGRGDLDRAAEALGRARALMPADGRIANNHGTILLELGHREDASTAFVQAADASDPIERARALFNLGTLELGRGHWARGWALFEHRRVLLPTSAVLPEWEGDAGDASVLITAEQGLGDIIQFARFLPEAARRRPLVLALPEAARGMVGLMPSLSALAPGRIRQDDGTAVAQCPLLSLPARLGVGSPAHAAYFSAPAIREHGLVVGIAWRGNAAYRFDRRRSLDIAQIGPILAVGGVRFRCLQRDATIPGAPIDAPVCALDTLENTARAIAGCDLVISVDTAIAHIAGALGRPVWLLNRFGGDWRWHDAPRARDQAPGAWYRDLIQFQPDDPAPPPGCWHDVVARVAQALRALVAPA